MTQVLRGAPRMIPPMVPVVSKSAAKEPAARSGHGRNRGIMRFSFARSRLTEAFAADMETARRILAGFAVNGTSVPGSRPP